VEVDPWGGNTARSVNSSFQPHLYTSYERDSDGGDDAMNRRYFANSVRFTQPDPYDGSYDWTDPQSLNRYSYVTNDPVNFADPTGLDGDLGTNLGAQAGWMLGMFGSVTLFVGWGSYTGVGGDGYASPSSVNPLADSLRKGQRSDPQNTLNNPSRLGSRQKGNCSITVNFSQGKFDNGILPGLPTGPGIYTDVMGESVFGVGFTVAISVFDGKGIGHIGDDSNRMSPNGSWTVNQRAVTTGMLNGQPNSITNDPDVSNGVPHDFHANNVTYWDHPGVNMAENSFHGTLDFTITAANGKEKCDLKFRVAISYERGGTSSVSWRGIR
jgi:RHS repeat-associated protein